MGLKWGWEEGREDFPQMEEGREKKQVSSTYKEDDSTKNRADLIELVHYTEYF